MATQVIVPADLGTLVTNAINAAIQSPAVQNMQWAMMAGCQPSVLNNMYFCTAASYSGSQVVFPHTDSATPHDDASDQDHVDTNDHVDTPPTDHVDSGHTDTTTDHVDTKMSHDDAHWDAWGSPQSHTDSSPHDDTSLHTDLPHDDTEIPHDDTSLPHDDTSIHDDIPGVHDDIPGSSFIYKAALTQVAGCGSMYVYDLQIPDPTGTSMQFSTDLAFGSAISVHFTTSIQETPLPAATTSNSFSISDSTGTIAGVITLYCTGNSAGLPSGYYASVSDMTVTLPTSVTSYSAWDGIVAEIVALGISTAQAVGAGDAILAEVTALVNGLIASEIESALNSVLATLMIAPCTC
jgi:hypothetical protein